LKNKSWIHSFDGEEVVVASSSNSGEGMLEPDVNQIQFHDEENLFIRYSNPYMYNNKEYDYMYHHSLSKTFLHSKLFNFNLHIYFLITLTFLKFLTTSIFLI
jgi:hypothetical protein